MWYLRYRLWQSGPTVFLCSLLLVIGFLIQFHLLYSSYQKQQRLEDYNTQMNEMHDTMKAMEHVANKTAITMVKLQKVVANHKAPHINFIHNKR